MKQYMTFNQDMTLKRRLPKAAVCAVLIIAMLWGMVPNNLLTVKAAVAPTLTVSLGTLWKYSQSGDADSVAYSNGTTSSAAMTAAKSGNTIILKESSANKNYSWGYVPIVVSVNVPANTTYQTTMHFNITGNPNKSSSRSSALAFVELFDLGSTDKSSSLTFNTNAKKEYEHSSSYTLTRDSRETNDFTGSGSVSVSFENNSSSEKTIYHYFGFFSGCSSATKYTHQVEAKCALSFGKLVESGAAPVINVKSSDMRYNVNNTKRDSYSKDNFVTEQALKEMNSTDWQNVMLLNVAGTVTDAVWRERLCMSGNTTNTISFSVKSDSTVAKMSYVPFSVPITVPAYTERTYYLSFKIDYERNTKSGTGFFAELIEGGVPNSFNTSASANMTGNTKLRVYSDGGDAHSGSVTVPLTLSNDTDSAKTMYGDYVFFAGFRPVGLYYPDPVYNLTLENIGYASYDDAYYAAIDAPNCTYTHNKKITAGSDYNATVTANTGYTLPSTITVKCNGAAMSASQYTWNSGTGKLSIAAKNIRGGISVAVNAVPNKYAITYSGLTGATLSTKPTTHTYGTATTVGNPTKAGYTFAGWKVNGGATATKSLTLGATAYTANISLEATWTVNKYNATFSGTNVTKSTGFGTNTVTYNTAWTGKFTANTGCDLPKSITVTVGGTTLASSKYTYTRSGSTGTVTIAAANVTGAVTVTAGGTLKKYDAAFSGTNVTASSGFGTGTATYKTAWTGTLTAASGYVLPDSITVKVGGTTLSTSKYTYSKSTGKVTITAAYVTGNITIAAEGHKHSYTSTVTTPATCTTNGVRTYTCSCGHSYTGTITKTGHTYSNGWTEDETYHWHVCTKCGAAGTKSSHVWNDGVVTTEPTEWSTGVKTFTCTTCSATKTETVAMLDHTHNITDKEGEWSGSDDDEHWHECNNNCGEKVDPEPHTLKQTDHKDPTCTEKGYTKYTCEKCGHVITMDIEVMEHNFSNEWTYDDTRHYHVCTLCHTETSGTEEHRWDSGTVEKFPDCTNTGVMRYECIVCGANKTEFIHVEAEAHDWGDWKIVADPTMESKGEIQSVCRINPEHVKTDEIPPLTDKDFWILIDSADPSCTEEGYEVYECEYGQVTITIPATEHIPVTDKRVEATCTKTGLTEGSHCGVCSEVLIMQEVISALGHDWSNSEITTHPTCTDDGVKTFFCSRCAETKKDVVLANGHSRVIDEAVAATCTETGKTAGSHCSVCGKIIKAQESIPALGHSWNDGVITTAPTENTAGIRTYTCTVCGATKTEAIAPLGHTHDWSSSWSKDDTYHWHDCLNDCGEKKDEAVHLWDGGAVTKQPTADAEGEKTFECTVCGMTKTEIIPAKGGSTTPENPDNPNNPDNPDNPNNPDDPDNPENPNNPDDPDNPDNPDNPVNPDNPDTPDKPNTPGEPDKTDKPDKPSPPDDINNGKISKEVQPGENAPKTELPTTLDELIKAILTSEEQETVKDGINIKIVLTVEDATEKVSAADKTAVENKIGNLTDYKLGQYLDVNLLKIIGDSHEKVTETNAPITVVFEVPEKLRGKTEYSVIRIHDGEITVLPDLDKDVNTVTIETDKFSTYALVYSEKASSTPPDESKPSDGDDPGTTSSGESSDPNGSGAGGQDRNPSTGAAVSFISFMTVLAVLTETIRRKRK